MIWKHGGEPLSISRHNLILDNLQGSGSRFVPPSGANALWEKEGEPARLRGFLSGSAQFSCARRRLAPPPPARYTGAMRRHAIPKPRKAPPVKIVYERSIAHMFLDAGYDLKRRPDNRIVLAKDGHTVPLYPKIALDFELTAPQLIREG
jgi:hypothetical protein